MSCARRSFLARSEGKAALRMSSSSASTAQPRIPISAPKAKFTLIGLFLLTALIWFGSRPLLATNFLPHWFCYVGNRRLLWTNVIADLVIGLSYVVISATLVTDIVMPGLRGPELAHRVTKMHPDIQVVYMSGYAEGLPEAHLPPNSIFLQKPFRFATLLEQLKLIRRRV